MNWEHPAPSPPSPTDMTKCHDAICCCTSAPSRDREADSARPLAGGGRDRWKPWDGWPGSTARPGNGKHGPMGGERKRTLLHERGKPSRGSRCRTRRLRSQLMAGTTNTRLRCRRRRLRRFHRCVGGRAPALHTTTRHTLTPTRRGSCVLRSCSFRLWLSLLWPSCEASFSSILTLTQCSERRALKPFWRSACALNLLRVVPSFILVNPNAGTRS